ncbi:hypothetical protein R1sor_002065 [Riccia sorocarpa]|uniref:Uncharacterized protein n=1 Tax=Riccia sorocarpa TaxID=122646 RepID=A0ABD3GY39_9MARC
MTSTNMGLKRKWSFLSFNLASSLILLIPEMKKERYDLNFPHPDTVTLTQLIFQGGEVSYFKHEDITKYTGSRKFAIAPACMDEKVDIYSIKLEFVTTLKLYKQSRRKWSTPVLGRSGRRLLEIAEASKEEEERELNETLSQDICLCFSVFNKNGRCFCGFAERDKRKSGTGASKTTKTTDRYDRCSEPSSSEETHNSGNKEVDDEESTDGTEADTGQYYSGLTGEDLSHEDFEKLKRFVDKRSCAGLIALEHGDTNLQLHAQGVMVTETTSTRALKEEVLKEIGWRPVCPAGGTVLYKTNAVVRPVYPWSEMVSITQNLQKKAETLWRLATDPACTTMEAIDEVFFGYRKKHYFSDPMRKRGGEDNNTSSESDLPHDKDEEFVPTQKVIYRAERYIERGQQ